ncbi:MAG: hypothetical protein M1819_003278 [Sarea resinae]|nr:MAG: hypothetical protein M1819_003278 [Sarea resinae]
MPRDLEAERTFVLGLGEEGTSSSSNADSDENTSSELPEHLRKAQEKFDLHPYVRPLTLADWDSVLKLEEATFPERERPGREKKWAYRLAVCSELTLGLFSTGGPGSDVKGALTADAARPPDSTKPEKKGVLLAFIVGTKCVSPTVTDASMEVPLDWKEAPSKNANLGHQEEGSTVALHGLAVLPEYQHKGLGTTILKSYIQRIKDANVSERIAIICHEDLIPFYESCGFVAKGKSPVTFGGGDWIDMVLEFSEIKDDD